MTINLITFTSGLDNQNSVRDSHEMILNELEKYFTVNLIDQKNVGNLKEDDFSILFIASGGVERMVMQQFEVLPRPFIMLADGEQNSLAAALEISSWLRSRGMKSEILHGDFTVIADRLTLHYTNFIAQRSLTNTRIGVIGTPSPWLISSNVDYLLAKRRWGVEYVNLPLERVYDIYDRITEDEVGESSALLAARALACRDASPDDMINAMRLYRAIKQVCEEESLNVITVNCFKQLERTGATGCLALSLLNDEGILAGCEGDLQSIFTMLAVKSLTGSLGFMANPSRIDVHNNEVVLGHCSIPLSLTDQFILRNHFETGKSIAIQGIVPIGQVTIVKCGGESLDEYYVSSGIIVENTNYINTCRTQLRIRLDSPVDYFLRNPLGNHHIMVPKNHEQSLHEFFAVNACKRVE